MKKIFVVILSLILLAACNAKEKEERIQTELGAKTFVTTSFNYTQFGLYSINFKKTSLPFKINEAASGGSIFSRATSSKVTLQSGEKINYTTSNCCFIWDEPLDKPMQVRVVWSVVFDSAYHDGKSTVTYDERTSRESAPGSRWCEAIVSIIPSKSVEPPDTVVFHFLKDGTVQAQLATFLTEAPLDMRQIREHSTSPPSGQYCKQEIANPYYGVPNAPHRE